MDIALAFPFLDLAATLMSGEHVQDDIVPIATIVVRDGRVDVVDGDLAHHERFPAPHRRTVAEEDDIYAKKRPILPNADGSWLYRLDHEHGPIPPSWFDEWEELARGISLGK
jgi:hypothetical protein